MSCESIVIALREPYISLILSGEKKLEIRRTTPALAENIRRLYLYYRGFILGEVEVKSVEAPRSSSARALAARWHQAARLSFHDALEYLWRPCRPCAYHLGTVVIYKHPVPIDNRPQSFIYATPEIVLACNKEKRKGPATAELL